MLQPKDRRLKMTLNDTQKELVQKWLEDHGKPVCPGCGNIKWKVVYEISGIGTAHVPHIPIICDACGMVLNYSAMKIGVI
jgi:hypothetical protein